MRKKELMVGNYVNQKNTLHQVLEIKENEVICKWIFEKSNIMIDDYYYRDIKPIPLTEEWLLKLGFEFINQNWPLKIKDPYIWKTNITLFADGHYYLTIDGKKISYKIEYVHQLQNLYFALTQKELTIK